MEHYQLEDDRRKIEYEQMISKIQTPLCVVMDKTKKTTKENSKLQADIKATQDSIKKLKVQARKAFKSTREHFRDKNENHKKEHAQLAGFAATTNKNLMETSKNLMMESNFRVAAINSVQNYIMVAEDLLKRDIKSVRDYSGKTKTTTIQPDIVSPDIMVKMKTAKTTKRKLDNTDINKFGNCPS